MSVESFPTDRLLELDRMFSRKVDFVEGDDQPLLDQTGNHTLDQVGRGIWADEQP